MADVGQWENRPAVRYLLLALRVVTAGAWLTGLGAMALEFGYYSPPLKIAFLHACQIGAAAAFASELVLRLVLRRSSGHVDIGRSDIVLGLLLVTVVAAMVLGRLTGGAAVGPTTIAWLLAVVQCYVGAHLAVRLFRMHMLLFRSEAHPARLLVISFLVLILVGALALKLPRAVEPGSESLYWRDALFTSTSAVCVTGLVVRATGSDQSPATPPDMVNGNLEQAGFTFFGQAVILVLIQLGGLGIMIVGTVFAVMLGRQMSLRHSLVMKDVVSSESVGQVGQVVRFIFLVTFAIEAVGAALLYSMWSDFDWSWQRKLFNAVFHSVSAFCNAGFSLTPDSLVRYHRYWQVHAVIAPLIVLGGLGFPVLMAIREWAAYRLRRALRLSTAGRRPMLSLHAKLVLATSAMLILLGTVGLLALESPLTAGPGPGGDRVGTRELTQSYQQVMAEKRQSQDPHVLREESAGTQLLDALFMSITTRTAGFNTVDIGYGEGGGAVGGGSLFLMVLLMIVGGSPASTAGGLKTVTFAVLIMTVLAVVRRRTEVEGFNRSLADALIKRAATIAVCYLGLVCTVTLLLTATESGGGYDFMQLLFESTSACGTVGLSTGITGKLTVAGRYVIIAAMFMGRLGPLTMIIALMQRMRSSRYQLPAESVTLG